MKIGVFIPTAAPIATPEFLREAGRAAEERGFHSIWVPEHVVLFDQYQSRYPYSDDGKIPGVDAAQLGILEPLGTLTYLAAVTERIRLGTGVCLVPQRNPVYTAKEVANLDWLSGGRVDFGVGVGWLAEEFAVCNVPFERRGARNHSYIEVMKSLWRDEISAYQDEFYDLPPTRFLPKPLQQPHPPLHFGGESDPALRRVARQGQGWFGFNLLPEEVASRLEVLDDFLAQEGRARTEIEISVGPYQYQVDRARLEAYHAAGVDQVIVVAMAAKIDELVAILDNHTRNVLEPAREL